jgi:uncharacterized protein (TIGR02145 family)
MFHRCAIIVTVISFFFAITLTCSSLKNPFTADKASISFTMLDAKGTIDADNSVTDTIGNIVTIGISPYLPDFIKACTLFVYSAGDTDTVAACPKFLPVADTQWYKITFLSIGKRNVTARATIDDNNRYEVEGKITIVPRYLAGTTQPAVATVLEGSDPMFNLVVTGAAPFTYQWLKNGSAIDSAKDSLYSIRNAEKGASGNYACLVTDKWGDTATTAPSVFTVVRINTKPRLLVKGRTNFLVNEACTLTVSVANPDSAETYKFAAIDGSKDGKLIDRMYLWRPSSGFAGVDTVVFTLTDDGTPKMADTQSVVISFSAKLATPDSIRGFTGVSRISGAYAFKWNRVSNADNYVVFRSASSSGDFAVLDTVIDTMFIDKIYSNAYYYYAIAQNAAGPSPQTKKIYSHTINSRPKWSHDTIAITIPEGIAATINLSDSVTDENGDNIALTLTPGAPSGDSITGGYWTFSPSYADSGRYTVGIRAFDGTDSASLFVRLRVPNVNRKPVFETDKPTTSSAVTGGSMLSIEVSAVDLDNDAVGYRVVNSTLPRTMPTLTDKTITWQSQPTDSVYGTITVCAFDAQDSVFATVKVAAGKVNAPPAIAAKRNGSPINKGQTVWVSEGDALKLAFTVSDPNAGQTVALSLPDRSPLSCGTAAFDSTNAAFSFVPGFTCALKDSATLPAVQFIATDNGSPQPMADTFKVNIVVVNTNRPPVIMVLQDTSVIQGKTLAFKVSSVDPDNDSVSLSATELAAAKLPDSASFATKTGIFTWTPIASQQGVYYLVFTATDGKARESDTVQITVKRQNQPPVITPLASHYAVAEGSQLKFGVKATDPDGDKVTISTLGAPFTAPKTALFANDTLTWTPTYADSGSYTITFYATDGSLLDTATTVVRVTNTNRAPVISGVRDTTIQSGATLDLTVSATDPDNDAVTLANDTFPSGATFTAATGVFHWAPASSITGANRVSFTATDALLEKTRKTITITVSNQPLPVITLQPVAHSACIGVVDSFKVNATSSAGTISYQWKKNDTDLPGATKSVYRIASVDVSDSGAYVCVVSGAGGIVSSSPAKFTVNTVSTVSTPIASPTVICPGATVQLAATGNLGVGSEWKWYTDLNCSFPVDGGNTGAILSVLPKASTVYYVRSEGPCGKTAVAGVMVSVNSMSVLPTGITSGSLKICSGNSTALTVNGGSRGSGAQWKWYTNEACTTPVPVKDTGTVITVSPTLTTTYYVRAEGGCEISGKVSTTISVDTMTIPPTGATANPGNVCPGGSTILSVVGGKLGTGSSWKWYKDANFSIKAATTNIGASISVTQAENTTYYVKAEGGCAPSNATASVTVPLTSFSITFDKNDAEATGSMAHQNIPCGTAANLTGKGFSKTGWTFTGWATTPTGNVSYADGASYSMGSADVILSAKWTINQVTVTFDKNGGDNEANPAGKSTTYGGTIGTLPTAPFRLGYSFSTWNTPPSGNGTTFTATSVVTASMSVYAQWTPNNYTLSFDAQGATNPANINVVYPATLGILPVPVFSGCNFRGWWTEKNGAGTEVTSNTVLTNNLTVYAKWTMTDIVGNEYKTVRIGDQTWMAENLKTTKYSDNTPIQLVTDSIARLYLVTPGYFWYDNDSVTYKEKFGALYNWYAVADAHKLAPAGWHVPTDAEWSALITYIGGVSVAGGKLKEVGTTRWVSPNSGATDDFAFTALPGGVHNYVSPWFDGIGIVAAFWSTTPDDASFSWVYSLRYHETMVSRNTWINRSGGSVRCIRD